MKSVIDSLDGLSDELKSCYEEVKIDGLSDDLKKYYEPIKGKFILKVEENYGFRVENVDGLKSTLSVYKEEARKATEKAKSLESLDPEKIREMETELSKLRKLGEVPDKDKLEALVKERTAAVEEKMKADFDKMQKVNSSLVDQLSKHEVENKIRSIVEKSDVDLVDGAIDFMMPHLKNGVTSFLTEDAKMSTKIVGQDGNPLLTKTQGSSENMSLEEHVNLKLHSDQFKVVRRGTGATGAPERAPLSGKSMVGKNNEERASIPVSERLRMAREADNSRVVSAV